MKCFSFQVWLGGFSPAIKHKESIEEGCLFGLGQFELFPVAMHPHAYGDFSLVAQVSKSPVRAQVFQCNPSYLLIPHKVSIL